MFLGVNKNLDEPVRRVLLNNNGPNRYAGRIVWTPFFPFKNLFSGEIIVKGDPAVSGIHIEFVIIFC